MPKTLGQFLEDSDRVSARQLQEARRSQDFFGGSLLSNLVRLRTLKEDEARELCAGWLGFPYFPLAETEDIPRHVLDRVTGVQAARRRVLPFREDEAGLAVATSKIGNDPLFRDLESRGGRPVVPHAIMEEDLEPLLERWYGIPAARRQTVKLSRTEDPMAALGKDSGAETGSAADEPQVGLDGRPLDSEEAIQELYAVGRNAESPGWMDLIEDSEPSGLSKSTPAGTFVAGGLEEEHGLVSPLERLARARDRQEIGRAAVELAMAGPAARVALLGVQKERLLGWDADGEGVDRERFKRLSIPLYAPSVFGGLKSGAGAGAAPMADLPANNELVAALGGGTRPLVALALPVIIKGRAAAVLYADSGPGAGGPPERGPLDAVVGKLAAALEILILRRKILS
jgi:hypothetical protein